MDRFIQLFRGLERAYGVYIIPQGDQGNSGRKLKGDPRTVRKRITDQHYREHLAGTRGLGVIPIRDDGTVLWAAIDVDRYNVNLKALASVLADTPFVVCRTKSGGAHLYVFFREPARAGVIRGALEDVATALGFGGSEIFPKQDTLTPKDVGNWINLPYYDANRTTRYALSPEDGRALSLEEFVSCAESRCTTQAELLGLKFRVPEDEFEGCPPCLEQLIADGFPPGTKNNGLFNLAVFAKRRFPDEWEARVQGWNERYMNPGTAQEVGNLIRSLRRKDYVYKCKDEPICSVCDKTTCRTRRHGVGGGDTQRARFSVEIGRVVRINTDPPSYTLEINGRVVEMEVEDLLEQRRFQRRALAVANVFVRRVKEDAYATVIQEVIDRAEQVEAPEEASPRGQFWILVERFLTERAPARERDELLDGRPWTDEDGTRIWFRSTDLLTYMDHQRFRAFTATQVYALLRERGLDHRGIQIKGKYANYWGIEAGRFTRQTESLETPRVDGEDF